MFAAATTIYAGCCNPMGSGLSPHVLGLQPYVCGLQVLDSPLLLKNKAAPSQLALLAGIQPKDKPPAAPAAAAAPAAPAALTAPATPAAPATSAASEMAVAVEAAEAAKAAEAAEAARRVMARGLRLFALYVAAGGALCMRGVVWRKIMPALHPDRHACSCAYSCTRHIHVCIPRGRGGDVRVFQHVNALKRQLDAGEVATHIYIYEYPLYILHVGCIGAAWCLLELGRSAYGALGTWRASPRAHLSRWLRLAGCEPSGDGGAD